MAISHLISQSLQSPELQLLDGSLAASQFLGDIADAALREEPQLDDHPLICRKALEQLRKQGLPIGICRIGRQLKIVYRDFLFPARRFPTPGYEVSRNSQQPSDEGRTLPFESREAGQRLLKDFGRHVLGLFASGHPARHVSINTREVRFVDLREPAGIALRGLDQPPLVDFVLGRFQTVSGDAYYLSNDADKAKGYGPAHDYFALARPR